MGVGVDVSIAKDDKDPREAVKFLVGKGKGPIGGIVVSNVDTGVVDVLFVVAFTASVVPLANLQSFTAAICSGSHSRQYVPTPQQSAIC